MFEPGQAGRPLTVVTYNVHRCIGPDGMQSPERIARVLRQLEADVIGLQEVDSEARDPALLDQLLHLAASTGCEAITGPTMRRRDATYGNVLLTRGRVLTVRQHDLSLAGREPRGAIDAEIDVDGMLLRVITVHLGLRGPERRAQVRRLLDALPAGSLAPLVLLGDFNEWLPLSRTLTPIRSALGREGLARTFPSGLPVFPLDRIWVAPRSALLTVEAHRTRAAQRASDHLPLVARVLGTPAEIEAERRLASARGGPTPGPEARPSW